MITIMHSDLVRVATLDTLEQNLLTSPQNDIECRFVDRHHRYSHTRAQLIQLTQAHHTHRSPEDSERCGAPHW